MADQPWYDEYIFENQNLLSTLDPLGIGVKPYASRADKLKDVDTEAGYNPYQAQALAAMQNIRGRASPSDVLARMNLGRVGRTALTGMRGGSPLAISQSLGRLGPQQLRMISAAGQAGLMEEQRKDALMGRGLQSQGQYVQDVARARQGRMENIARMRAGLAPKETADMVQRFSTMGEGLAEAAGRRGSKKKNPYEADV
jgi:hypothetical protein